MKLTDYVKSKLVIDVKDWWKWHSTHVTALFFGFPIAWNMSPQLQEWMSPKVVSIVAPIAAAILFLSRIKDQTKR